MENDEQGCTCGRASTSTPVALRLRRPAKHGTWLLLPVCIFMASLTVTLAMCPARCTCRDDTLQALCTDTGLEFVPIQLNPDLRLIDLRGNRISNVDYTLRIYQHLHTLDMSHNKIGYLGKHNFELQEHLIFLNLSHNLVSTVKKGAFKGLRSLRVLDFSYNEIQELEQGSLHETKQLEILDLSHNKITAFHDDTLFKNLEKLRVLSLDSNQILDVPGAVFKNLPVPSLEILDLSDNLIENLDENAFPPVIFRNVKLMNLSENVISDIHSSCFNPLHALTSLDLGYNNLTSVPTQQLAKLNLLNELDLSGNAFRTLQPVAFQSLFQMKVLRLSRMPYLQQIDARAFVDNIHLERIVMNENRLVRSLPKRVFHGNPHLMHISLRDNSISTLDASFFPLERLRSLDVSGNPFNCNCSLLWLWELAEQESNREILSEATNETVGSNEEPVVSLSVEELRCDQPEALHGVLLSEVPESAVRCEATWTNVAVVTSFVMALFAAFCIVLLLIGTERRSWTCGRDKEQSHVSAAETQRLAAGPMPPPMVMLMPDKPAYMEPWPNMSVKNEYMTARKAPHIVYV
ncbi:chondroadherin-like [Nilaparvata lugens]|uniref:chondroadherin-like n=1 Tax=Nilaparvata lugens TaxID=108931 RepID=UPI000B991189|nr:chondroadherin-like [Nilaparvata lugens]